MAESMDLAEQVVESFHHHIDCTMQAIAPLSQALADASELLVHALLHEGKILCCGEGASGLLAQHFTETLLGRADRERPALPALALNDAAVLSGIASANSYNDIFARQLRALGQPRDAVLLIAHATGTGATLQALQAAHDRGLPVVVLCSESHGDLRALLAPEDIELQVPQLSRARFIETGLLALNILSELIELQLFGSEV